MHRREEGPCRDAARGTPHESIIAARKPAIARASSSRNGWVPRRPAESACRSGPVGKQVSSAGDLRRVLQRPDEWEEIERRVHRAGDDSLAADGAGEGGRSDDRSEQRHGAEQLPGGAALAVLEGLSCDAHGTRREQESFRQGCHCERGRGARVAGVSVWSGVPRWGRVRQAAGASGLRERWREFVLHLMVPAQPA